MELEFHYARIAASWLCLFMQPGLRVLAVISNEIIKGDIVVLSQSRSCRVAYDRRNRKQ